MSVRERPARIIEGGFVYELVRCKDCGGTGYVKRRTYREICNACAEGTVYKRTGKV